MGFWDKVKDGLNEAGKKLNEGMEDLNRKHQYRKELLSKIKTHANKEKFAKWLKDHGVSEVKKTMTWPELLRKVSMSFRISNDDLRGFLKTRCKIYVDPPEKKVEEEVIDKESPAEEIKRNREVSTLDQKFEKILSRIEKYFDPMPSSSEEQFENQLYQFLSSEFRSDGYVVKSQINCRAGRIDISIDGSDIGLELKLASKSSLQRLYGQAVQYAKDFKRVGLIIFDIGDVKSHDLEDWNREFNGIVNVKSIVISAKKKAGRRGKNITVNINR